MRGFIGSEKVDRTVGESYHNDLDVGLYYAHYHRNKASISTRIVWSILKHNADDLLQ
jgi:hypothetical protein